MRDESRDAETGRQSDPGNLHVASSHLPVLSFIPHPSSFLCYTPSLYKPSTWEREPDEVDHARLVCHCGDDCCGLRRCDANNKFTSAFNSTVTCCDDGYCNARSIRCGEGRLCKELFRL